MYAILVREPGGDVSSYALSTGASTSETAMTLMRQRADEFIEEQHEQGSTEDYTIVAHPEELRVDVAFDSDFHRDAAIRFVAHCIDRVV